MRRACSTQPLASGGPTAGRRSGTGGRRRSSARLGRRSRAPAAAPADRSVRRRGAPGGVGRQSTAGRRLVGALCVSLTWLARLGLVVAGRSPADHGAVVVAVAPRGVAGRQRPRGAPDVLPAFQPLAQRTYVYDVNGNRDRRLPAREQPAGHARRDPHQVIARLPRRRGQGVLHATTASTSAASFRATLSNFASDAPQQGASTITMQVVKNDFLAGLERDGRYKLLQVHYALMLDRDDQGRDPRALPQHGVLRQQRLRRPGGSRDLLRQDRRPADVHRGRLPRRPRALAVGLRPDHSPERSRARFPQVLDRLVDDGYLTEARGRREIGDVRAARAGADDPRPAVHPHVLHRGAARLPAQPQRRPRRDLRGALLRRSTAAACASTPRSTRTCRPWPRRPATCCPTPSRASTPRSCRSTPRPARSGRWSAAAASCPTRTRRTWRCAPPDGIEHQAVHPRRRAPGRRPCRTTSSTAGPRACCPTRANPDEPFEIEDAVERGDRHAARDDVALDQLRLRRLSQIVGLNRVVDTTYRMAQSPYLYPGQPASEHRPIEPFASFATGANEMSPLDMASGAQTIANEGVHHEPYYVEYIDAPTAAALHPRRPGPAGPRPGRRPDGGRHDEGRAHRGGAGHGASIRSSVAGGRQDRDPAGQHQRLVRRVHAAAHDGGVGRRPRTATRRWTTSPSSQGPTPTPCRAAATRRRSGRRS